MTRLQLCATCHRPIEGSDTSGLLCNCNPLSNVNISPAEAVNALSDYHNVLDNEQKIKIGQEAIDYVIKEYLRESNAFAAELRIAWKRKVLGHIKKEI